MKKFDVSAAVNGAQKTAKLLGRMINNHRPEILVVSGVCGYIASLFMMYKHAQPLHEAIEEKDAKKIIKEAAPVVGTAVLSTAAVFGGVREGNKRYAAMSAAYTLTDAAFTEYRESAKEVLGEKKEANITSKSIENEIKRDPPIASSIISTGNGSTLFYERLTGRYFYSDINFVKSAVNDLNARMNPGNGKMYSGDDYMLLMEFHDAINLPYTSISQTMGWTINNGGVSVAQTAALAPDGTPCIALTYNEFGVFLDPYEPDSFMKIEV